MSLLWMDGFDVYGTNGQSVGAIMKSALYTNAQCYASQSTRTGRGYCIGFAQSPFNSDEIRKAFEAKNELVVGFAWKTQAISTLRNICQFRYDNQFGSVWNQLGLWMAGDGALTVGYYDNGNRVQLFTTGPNLLFPNVWHFIEVKVSFNATGGFIQVKIDGQTCVSGTGRTMDTRAPALCNVFRSGNGYLEDITNNQVYLDDLYICDTEGEGFNDFLGDVVIHAVLPSEDEGTNDALQYGGGLQHYTAVDEIPSDEDLSYLYSNAVGVKELFKIDPLPQNIIDVLAVSVHSRVKKDAAGEANLKLLCKQDGNTASSGEEPVTTQYVTRAHMYETAPDGGDWTKAKAESMAIGFEIA